MKLKNKVGKYFWVKTPGSSEWDVALLAYDDNGSLVFLIVDTDSGYFADSDAKDCTIGPILKEPSKNFEDDDVECGHYHWVQQTYIYGRDRKTPACYLWRVGKCVADADGQLGLIVSDPTGGECVHGSALGPKIVKPSELS